MEYRSLVPLAIVLLVVGVYFLGNRDLVGQAGVTEGQDCGVSTDGNFFLIGTGALERCHCTGTDCAKGSCQGNECRTTKTVTINPSGGSVTVDGAAPITDGSPPEQKQFLWGVGEGHTLSATSPPASTQGIQFLFDQWEPALPNSQVVVTRDDTYTPRWKKQYQLAVMVNPPDGSGGTVDVATGWYDEGTPVTLRATLRTNYDFDGWITSPAGECSGTGTCTVTVAGPKTVTATFSPRPRCGDEMVQSAIGELCDTGANANDPSDDALNGASCQSEGYATGTLACSSDCKSYDKTRCSLSSTDFVFRPAGISFLVQDELDRDAYLESSQVRTKSQLGLADVSFIIKNRGSNQGSVNYKFRISPDNTVDYWYGSPDQLSSSPQDIILDPGATRAIKIKNVKFESPGPFTIEFTLASPDELSADEKGNNRVSKQIDIVQLPPLFTYSALRKPSGTSDSSYAPIIANVNNYIPLSDAPCGYTPSKRTRFSCAFSIYPNTEDRAGDYKFEFKTLERSRCAGDKQMFLKLSLRDGSSGATSPLDESQCTVPTEAELPAGQDFVCGTPIVRTLSIDPSGNSEYQLSYRTDVFGCTYPETLMLKEYQCTRPNLGVQETGYVLLTSRQTPTIQDGTCTFVADVGKIYTLPHTGTIPLYRLRCHNNILGDVYSMVSDGGIDFYGLEQGNCESVGVVGYMHQSADPGLVKVPAPPVPLNVYLCDELGSDPSAPYAYRFLTSAPPDGSGCSLYTKTVSQIGYVLPP